MTSSALQSILEIVAKKIVDSPVIRQALVDGCSLSPAAKGDAVGAVVLSQWRQTQALMLPVPEMPPNVIAAPVADALRRDLESALTGRSILASRPTVNEPDPERSPDLIARHEYRGLALRACTYLHDGRSFLIADVLYGVA